MQRQVLLFLLAGILCLAACPKSETTTTTGTDTTPDVNVDVRTSDSTTTSGQRPRPQGETWAYVPMPTYNPGTEIPVEVRLNVPAGQQAWAELVPEDGNASEERGMAQDPENRYEISGPDSTINVTVPAEGSYRVRIVTDDGSGNIMTVTESEPFMVAPWPRGDYANRVAPYLIISGTDGSVTSYSPGSPVVATYRVPAGYPDGAWVGVVAVGPDGVAAVDAEPIRVVDLSAFDADTDFSFTPEAAGRYVFRIYPIPNSTVYYSAESQPFTVGDAAAAADNGAVDEGMNGSQNPSDGTGDSTGDGSVGQGDGSSAPGG
ncbi:hypothetical protein IT575_15640 [bacterium]|nr:hypothetical protein [bacterium]